MCSHVCTPSGIVLARQNQVTPGPKNKGLKAGLEWDTLGHEGHEKKKKKNRKTSRIFSFSPYDPIDSIKIASSLMISYN